MFADVPEDALREAEEATAQILAEVAAEPVVVEEADESADQDAALSGEPIADESSAPQTSSDEDEADPVSAELDEHIAPDSIPTGQSDELRIIDVSTDGENTPAMEAPAPAPVVAEPIESIMQASPGSNLIEVPPITPRVSEPDTKKKGLARFFDKQGLL
jgi:hypothetical protein